MSDTTYIPLSEPIRIDRSDMVHNQIALSVGYYKSKGGPVLNLRAVEATGDGTVRFEIFGSPNLYVTLEEGWKRDNAKKVAALRANVEQQIKDRSGPVFHQFALFVEQHGGIV